MRSLSIAITFALFLTGCTAPPHWKLDSLISHQKGFESKRLVYTPSEQFFGMRLEFIGSEGQLAAYLCSQGRQLGAKGQAELTFRFGEEAVKETLPLHQGNMRARLPDALALKTIQHLKEGKPLTIMLGTIEQTIQPEQFSALLQELGDVL